MFTRDERGIVGDWLLKVVIGIAIFGILGYDVGSILVNHFTLSSSAQDVANAISITAAGTAGNSLKLNDHEVLLLAKEEVSSEDGGVEGARVVEAGTHIDDAGVIHVRLKRTAGSLIVKRISAIEDWAKATADGQAGTT